MKALRNTFIIIVLLYVGLIVYAYLPYPTSEPKTFAGENSHFINLDGKTIHYTVQGSGPALVLVHGFGGSTPGLGQADRVSYAAVHGVCAGSARVRPLRQAR